MPRAILSSARRIGTAGVALPGLCQHPSSPAPVDMTLESYAVTRAHRARMMISPFCLRPWAALGGCSSMVEHRLPKPSTRVRFPSPAFSSTGQARKSSFRPPRIGNRSRDGRSTDCSPRRTRQSGPRAVPKPGGRARPVHVSEAFKPDPWRVIFRPRNRFFRAGSPAVGYIFEANLSSSKFEPQQAWVGSNAASPQTA